MRTPLADDRPPVLRWVYLAEASPFLDGSPVDGRGMQLHDTHEPALALESGTPRRLDLLLLLALTAAVIVGLCIVLGSGPSHA